MSFDRELAGFCGLTYPELEEALKGIYNDPQAYGGFLSEMTNCFNGYHFCRDETVETTFNTETCLAYLQCRIQRSTPRVRDSENSEVSECFLKRYVALALGTEFEKALEYDEKEGFKPFEYDRFRTELTLRDLVC